MHPISGTYRKPPPIKSRSINPAVINSQIDGDESERVREEVLTFLKDEKEINELFMVTDEELKMMCQMCPEV